MKKLFLIAVLLLAFIVAACSAEQEESGEPVENSPRETMEGDIHEDDTEAEEVSNEVQKENGDVVVELHNAAGEQVATANLSEDGNAVTIQIEGENLPPGEKGFHIHERGECEPPDFESAGGHFNPTGAEHGLQNPEGPHAGDLENIAVLEDGTVDMEVTANMVTMEEGVENSLFQEEGTSLVIHAEADDHISQPAGNAGDRIACGVIAK